MERERERDTRDTRDTKRHKSDTNISDIPVGPFGMIMRDLGADDRRAVRFTNKALNDKMKKIGTFVSRVYVDFLVDDAHADQQTTVERTFDFCWRSHQEYVDTLNDVFEMIKNRVVQNPVGQNLIVFDLGVIEKIDETGESHMIYQYPDLTIDDVKNIPFDVLQQQIYVVQYRYDIDYLDEEDYSDIEFDDAVEHAENTFDATTFILCESGTGGGGGGLFFSSKPSGTFYPSQSGGAYPDYYGWFMPEYTLFGGGRKLQSGGVAGAASAIAGPLTKAIVGSVGKEATKAATKAAFKEGAKKVAKEVGKELAEAATQAAVETAVTGLVGLAGSAVGKMQGSAQKAMSKARIPPNVQQKIFSDVKNTATAFGNNLNKAMDESGIHLSEKEQALVSKVVAHTEFLDTAKDYGHAMPAATLGALGSGTAAATAAATTVNKGDVCRSKGFDAHRSDVGCIKYQAGEECRNKGASGWHPVTKSCF